MLKKRLKPGVEPGNRRRIAAMKKGVVLWLLAALLPLGCVGVPTDDRRASGLIEHATTCAMCGASVTSDYLYYGTERSIGPGQGGGQRW